MKTFCGSLLVFVMSVQGLLLSSTLHANSSNSSSVHHSNHTKVEPDILTDAIMFCWKQVPNADESTLDTGFTVVAMMAFDELIRYMDTGTSGQSGFGSPTSKSFVRDFAKLPSTVIKVMQGLKKGATDEVYDEGHLWSQGIKVLAKGGVILVAGFGFNCETSQLEKIADGMNYPADYVSQLFLVSSLNRQEAIRNHEIESDVSYLSYLYDNFGFTLLFNAATNVFIRTGAVQAVSLKLMKPYDFSGHIYRFAFEVPNFLFSLGVLNSRASFHRNFGILQEYRIPYVQTILYTLATHFIGTYVRDTVTTYILVPVGQVAVKAPKAIWNYEHPIKDSMRESFEYYRTLVNENIIEPFYKYQADESFSDDDDYTSDL